MAMAAALLVASPFARAITGASLQPVAESVSGAKSGIEHGNRGFFVHRCSSEVSGLGRDGGACCGSVSRSGVSIRNAGFGWRASGLLGLDLSGLAARTNRIAPRRLAHRIAAEKPDLTNVAGTVLRLGRQGLEAGTKLVPESVPRPVAQAGVGFAGVIAAVFLLKSLFSTVAFILAIGAVSYAGYIFLTKGESSSSSGNGFDGSSGKSKSTDDALEEARKIMDKYK